MMFVKEQKLRTLVYYRDLLTDLVQRDIRLQYRRSKLGILWAQINPLLTLIIFSFVFQKIVPLNIPNYPSYVFIGLLTWSWFSSSVGTSPYRLLQSRDLVRKPKFSTEIIVAVSITSNLVTLLLSFPILFGLLIINGLIPNWTLLFLPLVLAIQFFFTLGLALLLSATNVYFRDVVHIVGVLVSVWFYITPIFYLIPDNSEYSFITIFNPMAQLIDSYRKILLYGQPPNLLALLISGGVAAIVCLIGFSIFRNLKYGFVDEL
jgi:lipopolysaccharide transport system permease protein